MASCVSPSWVFQHSLPAHPLPFYLPQPGMFIIWFPSPQPWFWYPHFSSILPNWSQFLMFSHPICASSHCQPFCLVSLFIISISPPLHPMPPSFFLLSPLIRSSQAPLPKSPTPIPSLCLSSILPVPIYSFYCLFLTSVLVSVCSASESHAFFLHAAWTSTEELQVALKWQFPCPHSAISTTSATNCCQAQLQEKTMVQFLVVLRYSMLIVQKMFREFSCQILTALLRTCKEIFFQRLTCGKIWKIFLERQEKPCAGYHDRFLRAFQQNGWNNLLCIFP